MNANEALLLLGIIKRIYHTQEVSVPIAQTWAAVMPRVSYTDAERATLTYMQTGGQFPPKPSDVLSILAREQVGSSLLPEEAWREVMDEVRRVGFHPLPRFVHGKIEPPLERTFSSPLIERAVKAVGWDTICLGEIDDMPTIRAQFIKALQRVLDQERRNVQIGAGRDMALAAGPASALPVEAT